MRFITILLEKWNGLDSRSRLWCGYTLIAVMAVAMGWTALSAKTSELERKRVAREGVLKELLPLKVAYQAARASSDTLTGRMASLRPDDSPSKIIEEIGIKGKGVKILPAKGEERAGIIEDAADVRIDGLTANEMVNLIYRLEKSGRPVTVKKANLRVRFDDPSRFDLALTVALLKAAPVQPK